MFTYFLIIMYFVIGFIINAGYYSANKYKFNQLTDTQLTINFIITWIFWVIVYFFELLKHSVIYFVRKG